MVSRIKSGPSLWLLRCSLWSVALRDDLAIQTHLPNSVRAPVAQPDAEMNRDV